MNEAFVLALDLGGSHATAIAYSSRQGVLVRTKAASRVDLGPRQGLPRLAQQLKGVRALSELPWRAFKGVCVGAPGPLDLKRGRLLKAPNLKGWDGTPLAGSLSKALGLPVRLENDARCAAWGEARHGAGRGLRDLAMLTLGTGVGGGIILDGRLRRGPDGSAGELGFLYLDRSPQAPACAFGLPGSLEALAAGPALARAAALGMRRGGPLWALSHGHQAQVTPALAHAGLLAGDPAAVAAWEGAGHAVGLAIASLINALNLEAVLLGGGVMTHRGGTRLLQCARATARKASLPQAFARCRILAAALGADAGAIGAAELALEGKA